MTTERGTYKTRTETEIKQYICKYIIYVNRKMNIFHLTDFFKES